MYLLCCPSPLKVALGGLQIIKLCILYEYVICSHQKCPYLQLLKNGALGKVQKRTTNDHEIVCNQTNTEWGSLA